MKSVKWLTTAGLILLKIRNNLDECNSTDAQYGRFVGKIACDLKELAEVGNVLLQERPR